MQLKRESNFETLKKSHKKQIVIGALAICIVGGTLTLATTRAKYKVTDSVNIANGTVNYTPYDFKIMAMYKSDDKTKYTEIQEMPSEGYVINEEKTYCTIDNKNQIKGKIKTINGNVSISKLSKCDKCYLYFDKKEVTSEDTLANLGISNVKDSPTTFSNVATTDEGIFKVEDGMYGGYSYYWRGAVTNNYIKFADFCWRFVRINGDGSIRIIYDGVTCNANGTSTSNSIVKANVTYNAGFNNSSYVGWTYTLNNQRPSSTAEVVAKTSYVKTQLELWYSNNIAGANDTKVADGKYCNDRNTQDDEIWRATGNTQYYAGYQRNVTNKQATLSCSSGDVYMLKVGLITSDEVIFAGGLYGINNNKYYLYNGQSYWTMSPYYWLSSGSACMFRVGHDGFLYWDGVNSTIHGLRPVINLRSDVTFSSGNGTQSNPFIVA